MDRRVKDNKLQTCSGCSIEHGKENQFLDSTVSIPSVLSQLTLQEDENGNIIDQYQLLQLAENMESTAMSIRSYCQNQSHLKHKLRRYSNIDYYLLINITSISKVLYFI